MLQHGHSSGLHCFIPSMESLVDSIKLVMDDLLKRDSLDQREKPRKMFIAGASLGAFIWCVTIVSPRLRCLSDD